MTHLEIAELVGKRPDNVKRTIETLVNQGVIAQPQIEDGIRAANGVTPKVYVFKGEQGKRDSIVVVAQLCPEFTARLVDRWQELEQQIKQPFELSKLEVLQMAIESEKQKVALEQQVAVLEPKALALDTIADTTNTYTIRECAKTIGIKEKHLVNLLLEKGWCYRESSGRLQPYATKTDHNIFINRPSPIITNPNTGEEKVHLHMRVTAHGLTRITALVNSTRGG